MRRRRFPNPPRPLARTRPWPGLRVRPGGFAPSPGRVPLSPFALRRSAALPGTLRSRKEPEPRSPGARGHPPCPRYPVELRRSRVRRGDGHAEEQSRQSRRKLLSPYRMPRTQPASRYPETCRAGISLRHWSESLFCCPPRSARLPARRYRARIRTERRLGAVPDRLCRVRYAADVRQLAVPGAREHRLSQLAVARTREIPRRRADSGRWCAVYLLAPCPPTRSRK